MLFERIYDTDLAQASYFIGCQATGEAIVVDARRDIAVYEELAVANDMRITAVTETHVHADYLSGSRELAAATGATTYVSGEGGPDWLYTFEAELLSDGDTIDIGNISLQALHTPGHTPEHLSLLVTDKPFTAEPGFLLSGDFVFVGDLGRPDLLDEAAGGKDTRFEGAKQMFASLRDKFLTLPDYIQVHPGHGAGSACGKALGAVPSTTVGYERLYSWWGPYVASGDEEGFVAELLDGQPDAPGYFGRMKRQNVSGPAVLGPRTTLTELDPVDVARDLDAGRVTFVDTRETPEVHERTVAGALHIPGPESMATFGAWAVDPERDTRPLVLLADGADSAHEMWDHLIRVGVDAVAGYVTALDGLPQFSPTLIEPGDVPSGDDAALLDIRDKDEHAAGHVPGSKQLHGGRVLWNLDGLPKERTIVAYCETGRRSSVVASALRNAGYDVAEIDGSYIGWQAQNLTAAVSAR